jgi:DNA replication and repair protein RecF
VRIAELDLRNFRNYERAAMSLDPGVTVIYGPVGAGKTNLLEAIYFGSLGKSFRTANDRELVRFGESATRVCVTSANGVSERRFEVGLEPGRLKVMKVDGVRRERLADVEGRPLLCVFIPDRLELVKGTAASRRAHLDTVVAALRPAQREVRALYGRALAQRNVLLARVRAGAASRGSLGSWNRELAIHGIELMNARAGALELIAPHFTRHAHELGFEDGEQPAAIEYRPSATASSGPELEAELAAATDKDVERGFTTIGPHRDDVRIEAGGRELRRFGSQGQQRLALLALLLAERDALAESAGMRPVLLLDDVMSELDNSRRRLLLDVLLAGGQTLITTADPASVDADSIAMLHIVEGAVDG